MNDKDQEKSYEMCDRTPVPFPCSEKDFLKTLFILAAMGIISLCLYCNFKKTDREDAPAQPDPVAANYTNKNAWILNKTCFLTKKH